MSRELVYQTVGAEPGDYSNGASTRPHGLRYLSYESWLCDEGQLLVMFDDEGMAAKVVVADILDVRPKTFLGWVRRLLEKWAN